VGPPVFASWLDLTKEASGLRRRHHHRILVHDRDKCVDDHDKIAKTAVAGAAVAVSQMVIVPNYRPNDWGLLLAQPRTNRKDRKEVVKVVQRHLRRRRRYP
jgi:glycine betaine/choline ABC-type transport system substrate-binding protein